MVNHILVHVYDYLHPPKYDIILEVPDTITIGGLKQMVSNPKFHPSVMVAYVNLDITDDSDLADENADIQIMRIPHHKIVSHEGASDRREILKKKAFSKKALPQNYSRRVYQKTRSFQKRKTNRKTRRPFQKRPYTKTI